MSINKLANNIYLPPVALSMRDNYFIAKRFFKQSMKIKKSEYKNKRKNQC